jgi:hypothetical protein
MRTDPTDGIGLVYAVRHARPHWTHRKCQIERGHHTARIAMPRYVISHLNQLTFMLTIRNMAQVELWAVANARGR